jgi:peptidyl-prolyl cis-trans isomerase C
MRPSVLAISGLLGLIGCSSGSHGDHGGTSHEPARHHGLTTEQAGQAVATVGDTTITAGELADQLSEQSPFLRARYASRERRLEFLQDRVRFELLAAEAHRLHYDESEDVTHARDQMMIQLLMKDQFEDRIRVEDVSDEEVRAYYDAHPGEFHKPQQMRISHIRMHDRAAAQRVLAQLLARPTDMALFRQLAEQNDEDPTTKDRFGDIGFVSRPAERQEGDVVVPDAVATAAFTLSNLGTVADHLVEAPDGFHIVKLTAKREALVRTLEDASRVIRNKLWREKREQAVTDFVARLRTQAHVEVDEHALSQVHVDVPAGAVPTTDDPVGALAPPGATQ